MTHRNSLFAAALAALVGATPAFAQQVAQDGQGGSTTVEKPGTESFAPALNFGPQKDLSDFLGIKLTLGGAFTQSFQALDHSNNAAANSADELGEIRPGFNLPTANLTCRCSWPPGSRCSSRATCRAVTTTSSG